ncbi:MAG: hypothetical protein JWP04_3488 [Belnapia sp.]|jgi:hypothetical protein|nr:hypothetical protein [Belnapia sp.]
MIIRISPQWQVTIPKAFRQRIGAARQMEARMEQAALVLRPVLAPSPDWVEQRFAAEGITREVLWEAMRVIEQRRRREVS